MFYIVSYDIPDDNKRNRISTLLLNFGNRVQESVFECIMDEVLHEKMTQSLYKLISEEDSVRIYSLCANCEKLITVLGRGSITKDEDVYIL
jgi:CRISPR-associated protein Cas2